jgi:DNA-binding GntR family transcriptional regulator
LKVQSADDDASTASQAVRMHAILREDILTTVIRPGDVIMEPEIARLHGVSRTPVREALRTLATEGWVTSMPRRGYLVRPLSFHDVREVMQLRIIVEPPLAAAAARSASPALAAHLRATISAQYREGSNLAERLRSAEAFHLECASASQNHRASALLRPLIDEISRLHYLKPEVQQHLASDVEHDAHQAIVSAIAAGDAVLSESLMRSHLEESHAAMLGAF